MMLIIEVVLLFIISTIFFDILHYCLHQWKMSRFALLRTFAQWHEYHHEFLDKQMNIQQKWYSKNLIYHIIPEYLTSIAGTLFGFLIFSTQAVIIALIIHTIMMIGRLYGRGEDINHKTVDRIGAKHSNIHVNPTYHFKHHIFPEDFFSSFIGITDIVMGKLCPIKKRRFLITGASGAFGAAMKKQIERKGGIVTTVKYGTDYTYDDYSVFDRLLPETDILVLAHGSKYENTMEANYTSCVTIIDKFIGCTQQRLVPPEVWAMGSEIEVHGSFGIEKLVGYDTSKKRFSKAAKHYHLSNEITVRYIVPSAFASAMGWGIMTGSFVAKYALFFIRRGFYYIPVTYTGLAFINYIRFKCMKPETKASEVSEAS